MSEQKGRLHNLDYLRGLAAFGIMLYHFLSWSYGDIGSDLFLGRLGLYGVSIFYVLSGLTLFHVYFYRMEPSFSEVVNYLKKRVFRIFPLLWLVTLLTVFASDRQFSNFDIFLNLTGLFGFFKWDSYVAIGTWSIGNEIVFYFFFPLFVLISKFSRLLMSIFCLIILGIYLWFAFVILTNDISLGDQWRDYVNPLNQLFLFLGGFLIGLLFNHTRTNNLLFFGLLIAGVLLFIFYPTPDASVYIVTNFNRIIFTLSCFLICLGSYKIEFVPPLFIHRSCAFLGDISYSVYLVHPIVYSTLVLTFSYIGDFLYSDLIKLILAIIGTLLASYFIYEYYEKFFIKLGRKRKKMK